ncbi:hypothetical protein PanWU01x14_326330 [Parasponia andersonii]|uniref:Uncharacterized protein n=1 Tax=Parasponia andersonii TaxID=3476 RepID=A0A2P5AJH6_PARAD|nr:hypothetical protein PanWU01x14_326330 [Parasponia andersonii]
MTLLSSTFFDILGELSIDVRNRESSEKEESIKQMQKIIQDKSHNIASLESKIELLQVRSHFFSQRFFSCGFKVRIIKRRVKDYFNLVHKSISYELLYCCTIFEGRVWEVFKKGLVFYFYSSCFNFCSPSCCCCCLFPPI